MCPKGYLTVAPALGQDKPRHLVISLASADGAVNAVIELGFINPVGENAVTLLDQASDSVGGGGPLRKIIAPNFKISQSKKRNARRRSFRFRREELRVSRTRSSKRTKPGAEGIFQQARLEQQQAELEQTNAQLEEQAQQLETQRDELERTASAVQLKARGTGAGKPIQIGFPGQHVA